MSLTVNQSVNTYDESNQMLSTTREKLEQTVVLVPMGIIISSHTHIDKLCKVGYI